MKKSLVVGVSALLLSLVAVTGCAEVPTNTSTGSATDTQVQEDVVHVKDINVRDDKASTPGSPKSVKHGQEVFIKGAQVYGRYNHKLYIHEGFKSVETQADVEGIALEVRNDAVDFSEINVGSIINVRGVVDTLNGHFYVKNAAVEVTKDNLTGDIKPTDPIMILNNVDRMTTLFATPMLNGLGAFTTLQACEDLGPITKEGKTIKVVFPGEDTNIDDGNYSLMDYVIPAGLSDDELNILNKRVFKDLTDESEAGSTIKAGHSFTAMTAITYNNNIGFEYVPFLGCSQDFGRLGMTQDVVKFSSFEEMKTEWVTPLIVEGKLDSFPNLSATDTTGKSLIYSYVPSDEFFNQGGIEIDLNSYEMETVFAMLTDNLEKQKYYMGEEETDPNTGITQVAFASDDTGEQDYTVYLQNLVSYGKVIIEVKTDICKFVKDQVDYKDFATAKKALNTNVNTYDRRYPFTTVQPLGFDTLIPDLTDSIKAHGLKFTNITVDKENENYYNEAINIGISPISQHRFTYNFDAPMPEIVKKEGKNVLVLPEEIEIRYNRFVKDMQKAFVDAGFVFSEHQMLISGKEPDGTLIPAYFYYNEVSGESIVYTLTTPTKKIDDKTKEPIGDWIGNWGILIIDEVVTAEISTWVFEPATELEPTYTWTTERDSKYFKDTLKTTQDFILPEFNYFEFVMLPGKTEDGRDGVQITFFADTKDPDHLDPDAKAAALEALYKATLEKAGWTVTGKPIGEAGKQHILYTATKTGSDITYEFASNNEAGVLIVVVYKNK